MPSSVVNLDALIVRQDFDAQTEQQQNTGSTPKIMISELEQGKFTLGVLRKPDFQRETSSWSPEQVRDLVKAFVQEDLVPAVIFWRSPNNDLFVIDGSHRLSSLIAWVHDDYGDGNISRSFFQNEIPPAQIRAAKRTRQMIEEEIGPYQKISDAFKTSNAREEFVKIAKTLASHGLDVQWVTGDAGKAEHSFFKINQQGTKIDPTELRLLKARKCPNALSARAIMRGGTGHPYWKKFEEPVRSQIEEKGREIYANLFTPVLDTATIKTTDLPVAGRVYSAQTLPLLFDMVNISNDVLIPDEIKSKKNEQIGEITKPTDEDNDGSKTVNFLIRTQDLAQRVAGQHSSSLGLFPLVYFYSNVGRHQPSSFLAVIGLLKDLELHKRFNQFSEQRQKFEDFILQYKDFANQVIRHFRGGPRSVLKLKDLFLKVFEHLRDGCDFGAIVEALHKDSTFSFLVPPPQEEIKTTGKKFTAEVKSLTFIKDALKNAPICALCNCRMPPSSITFDHKQDKKDDGTGSADNAQMAHPYCNSTYKDYLKNKT
ncbi:MAG: HNH endonuclease family protein [Candidatus Acidiferrales bacterium]